MKYQLNCHRICNRNHVSLCIFEYNRQREQSWKEDRAVYLETQSAKQKSREREVYDNEQGR